MILCYHRVGAGGREIDLPLAIFHRQLRWLAESEPVLSLHAGVGEGGGVVLTFDDGYRDFYERVLPALVEHRIPATLYLATGLVGNGSLGRDALTWDQLREAVQTGLVTVGSHTHSHADLSRATEREAEQEMRRSKELVEDRLGVPCHHFAYPWSVASPAAQRVARRLFRTAALHAWRTNTPERLDLHQLGRIPVLRGDGLLFFKAKAKGMLNGEAQAYRLLRRGPWGPPGARASVANRAEVGR
ncbi:MAG TPA: polysaccharide deacetylase family protein [Actinomycetota bacterium]|nr:polysaccharide deacetylase family protein [Actinomycetota bacterium]